jgi:hypothetical protein
MFFQLDRRASALHKHKRKFEMASVAKVRGADDDAALKLDELRDLSGQS